MAIETFTATATGHHYTRCDGVIINMPATRTLDIESTQEGTTITSTPKPGLEVEWASEIRAFAREFTDGSVSIDMTATVMRESHSDRQ